MQAISTINFDERHPPQKAWCEHDLAAGSVFTMRATDAGGEKIVTVRVKRAGENDDGVSCFIIRRSDRDHDEVYHIDPGTGALVPGRPRIPGKLRSRMAMGAAGLAIVACMMVATAKPASAHIWLLRLIAGAQGAGVAAEVTATTALRAGAAAAARGAVVGAGTRMAAFATIPRIAGQRFIVVINEMKFEATAKFSASATAGLPLLFWNNGNSSVPRDFAQLVYSNCANGWARVRYEGYERFNWTCG